MILLVDDEDRAREMIGRMLERAGYGVVGAADGLAALSFLEKGGCDLVLSDILMPNLKGYALVARIRSKWPNMPVILMSGYLPQDAGKRMESILNTSIEFIPKPIDPSALTAIVQRLIPAVTASK